MLIFIEGADGVGKTTLGSKLSNLLNCEFIDRPVHYLLTDKLGEIGNGIAESAISAYYSSSNSHFQIAWFNATGLIYLQQKFSDSTAVVTRGLLTSYMWNSESAEELFDFLCKKQIGTGINIVLDASDEVRLERMLKRNLNESEVKAKKIRHFDIAPALKYAKRNNIKTIYINTNDKSAEQVFDIAVKELTKYLVN